MPEQTRNSTANIFEFNVGGELFYFSKETLELAHNKGSLFEKTVQGVSVKKTPFLDLDPALFRKFCAPYLRHKLMPVSCDFSSITEQRHLVAAASLTGLSALSHFIEHEMTNRSYHVTVKLPLLSQSLMVSRSLLMQSTDTLADLREKLKGLIVNAQEPKLRDLSDDKRFSFEGFILSEDKTLEYYNIGPASVIELV